MVRSCDAVSPRVSEKAWNVRVLFFRLVLVLTVAPREVSNPNLKDISEKLLEKESVCLELGFLFRCEPQTPEMKKVERQKKKAQKFNAFYVPDADFNTDGCFFSSTGLVAVGCMF